MGLYHSNDRITEVGRSKGVVACLNILLVCLSTLAQQVMAEEGISIQDAEIVLLNNVYSLNAQLEVEFNDAVKEAIESGVPLTVKLEIFVMRPRELLWDEEIASLRQRYKLKFHALTEQYIVNVSNSGAINAYPSLYSAMASIREITGLPIIDAKLLESHKHYLIRMRGRLELSSLPPPLRLNAYLSSQWWLSSGWIEFKI